MLMSKNVNNDVSKDSPILITDVKYHLFSCISTTSVTWSSVTRTCSQISNISNMDNNTFAFCQTAEPSRR